MRYLRNLFEKMIKKGWRTNPWFRFAVIQPLVVIMVMTNVLSVTGLTGIGNGGGLFTPISVAAEETDGDSAPSAGDSDKKEDVDSEEESDSKENSDVKDDSDSKDQSESKESAGNDTYDSGKKENDSSSDDKNNSDDTNTANSGDTANGGNGTDQNTNGNQKKTDTSGDASGGKSGKDSKGRSDDDSYEVSERGGAAVKPNADTTGQKVTRGKNGEITFTKKAKDSSYVIDVKAKADSGITGSETLSIVEIDDKDELYDDYIKKLNQRLNKKKDGKIKDIRIYDFQFTDKEGNPVELANKVEVTISYNTRNAPEAEVKDKVRAFSVTTEDKAARATVNGMFQKLLTRAESIAESKSDKDAESKAEGDSNSKSDSKGTADKDSQKKKITKVNWISQKETKSQITKDKVVKVRYALKQNGITGVAVTGKKTSAESKKGTTKKKYKYYMSTTGDGYKVTVNYGDDANLPDNVKLSVKEIDEDSEDYEEYLKKASASITGEGQVGSAHFYDISILNYEDHKIQPSATVQVTMEFDPLYVEKTNDVEVLHFEEKAPEKGKKGGKKKLSAEKVDKVTVVHGSEKNTVEGVEFETDTLPVYGVVQTTLEKDLTASDGKTYKVKVSYDSASGIPADTELEVTEIKEGDEGYDDYVNKTAEELGTTADSLSFARAFDITLTDPKTGEKYQPNDKVKLSIQLMDQEIDEDAKVSVVHFGGENGDQPEVMDSKLKGKKVEFETDGFSVFMVAGFTVDFHWGDYTYSIAGQSEILLSELFEKLGVSEIGIGDVKDVSFSNEELVKVVKKEAEGEQAGDWLLKSVAPFSTEETLTLELKNGESVEIRVTDELGDYNENYGYETGQTGQGNDTNVSWTEYCNSLNKPTEYIVVYRRTDGNISGNAQISNRLRIQNSTVGGRVTKLVFEEGITAVGQDAFGGQNNPAGCLPKLKTVVPCNTLQTLNQSSFRGCTNLTNYDFTKSKNINTIAKQAFNPTALTKVDLSGYTSLTTLGPNAFNVGTSLKEVDLSNCSALQTLMKENGNTPFSGNANVEKLTISDSKISSLEHFVSFKNLKILNAHNYGRLSDTIVQPNVEIFINLTSLDLSGSNKVTQITNLNKCTKLQTLNLSGTSISSLNLSNNNDLKTIDLSGCNNLTSLDLTGKTRLEVLKLPGTINTLQGITVDFTSLTDIWYEGPESEWNAKNLNIPDSIKDNITMHFTDRKTEVINDYCDQASYRLAEGEFTDIDKTYTRPYADGDSFNMDIKLHFAEIEGERQFSENGIYYTLPENISTTASETINGSLTTDPDTHINVDINYDSENRRFSLVLTDEFKSAIGDCKNSKLEFTIPVSITSLPTEVDFGNKHVFYADHPHDPYVESVKVDEGGSYSFDEGNITYKAVIKAEDYPGSGDFNTPYSVLVIDNIKGTALGELNGGVAYKITKHQDNSGSSSNGTFTEFPKRIEGVEKGDTITLTYAYNVSLDEILYLSEPDEKEIFNKITITSKDVNGKDNKYNNSVNDSAECNKGFEQLNYLLDMSITSEISGRGETGGEDSNSYQDITWNICSNSEGKIPQAGYITGTVDYPSSSMPNEASVKINPTGSFDVIVSQMQNGNKTKVEKRTVSWDNLDWNDDTAGTATWSYKLPDGDKGKCYIYDVSMTTRVLLNDLKYLNNPVAEVVNTVKGHTGDESANAEVSYIDGNVSITKEAVEVTEGTVKWKITAKAKAQGHNRFIIKDLLPLMEVGDTYYKDSVNETNGTLAEGVLKVTGLQNDESYSVRYNVNESNNPWDNNALEIEFYKSNEQTDDNKGLNPIEGSEDDRTIEILLTTQNDSNWIEASSLTTEQKIHTNKVEVHADDYYYAKAEAKATPQKPNISIYNNIENKCKLKEIDKDEISYPVFEFVIAVGGLNDDMLDNNKLFYIESTFANEHPEYWKLFKTDPTDPTDANLSILDAKAYKTNTGFFPDPDSTVNIAEEITEGFTCSSGEGTATSGEGTATFTLDFSKDNLKRDGSYWDYYQIVYHIIPKNAESYQELKALTVSSNGDIGKKEFTTTAKIKTEGLINQITQLFSGDLMSHDTFIFEYLPIQKRIKGEIDGNWVYYEIIINPDKLKLAPEPLNSTDSDVDSDVDSEQKLVLNDTFYIDPEVDQNGYEEMLRKYPNYTSQSIDYSEIKVFLGDSETPLNGKTAFNNAHISYDYSGYVGTFKLPDQKKIRIEYKTRVKGKSGDTVTFSNTAELASLTNQNAKYSATVTKENWRLYPGGSDTSGTENDCKIRLFKYENGHMEAGLNNAEFLLHDSNMNPMYDGNGEEILFKTGNDGYVTISLRDYGLSLKKNTVYYLEEIKAPEGEKNDGTPKFYKKNNTMYSFVISDNPSYAVDGVWVYYNNDVMKVKNYEGDPGICISKRFTGNGSLTDNEKKNIKFIVEEKGDGNTWTKPNNDYEVSYDPSTAKGTPFAYGYYRFDKINIRNGKTYRIRETGADPYKTLKKKTWVLTTVEDGKQKTTVKEIEYKKSEESNYNIDITKYKIGEDGKYQKDGNTQSTVLTEEQLEDSDDVACVFEATAENSGNCIDVLCINEYIEHKLTIKKVDKDNGALLPDADFTVFDESNQAIHVYTTRSESEGLDKKGTFEVKKEDDPKYAYDTLYYIAESRAPVNYVLPEEADREKVYFYFSSSTAETPPAGAPEGAIDLSKSFDTITITNRKSKVDIPVRKVWDLPGDNTGWPNEVDHIIVGLYRSSSGSEETPVTGDDGQPLTISLTKLTPFDTFKNLAYEDILGNPITYTVRELHVYADSEETTDLMDSYAPSYHTTDTDLRVVTNREGVKIKVEKHWFDKDTNEYISDKNRLSSYPDISFDVYRKKQDLEGVDPNVPQDRTAMEEFLNDSNSPAELVLAGQTVGNKEGWTKTIGSLDKSDAEEHPYYYFVLESQSLDLVDQYVVTNDDEGGNSQSDNENIRTLYIRNTGEPAPICKVGDVPFYTLNSAMEYIIDLNMQNADIEMLRDYIVPRSDALQIPKDFNVTLKTASEGFTPSMNESDTQTGNPGDLRHKAIIKRYKTFTDLPLFMNYGTFNLENITIDGDNISANRAVIDSQGTVEVKADTEIKNAKNQSLGGVIVVRNGTAVISGGEITSNKAAAGGVIYLTGSGNASVTGGTIAGNQAADGGAIYNAGNGEIAISGGTIKGNSATSGSGGAVYAASGTVTVSGGTIGGTGTAQSNGGNTSESNPNANTATSENGKGGAIYSVSATVVVKASANIAGNRAVNGGAIYSQAGITEISSGTITGNESTTGNGGAVYVGTGSAKMTGGTLSGNVAKNGYGGAIYIGSGKFEMSSGDIKDNNQAKNGAAVFTNTGSASFSGGYITNNRACVHIEDATQIPDADGGAVGIGTVEARLTFSGSIKINNNYLGKQGKNYLANVCLDQDSDAVINANGIPSDVGIYVPKSIGNVYNKRGKPGDIFATFSNSVSNENGFKNKFKNDRFASYEAKADVTGKKIYWGVPLTVEIHSLDSYQNALPPRMANGLIDSSYKIETYTYYPKISSGDTSAVSVLAQELYAQKKSDLLATTKIVDKKEVEKPHLVSTDAFGSAFLGNATEFGDYLTTFTWDDSFEWTENKVTKRGSWSFKKRDGGSISLKSITDSNKQKLIVYYTKPAYISIENNTGVSVGNEGAAEGNNSRTIFISDLKINVQDNSVPLSIINKENSDGQIGYGYIVARNGLTRGELLPVSESDLKKNDGRIELKSGESIKFMIPGGCGLNYTLEGDTGGALDIVHTDISQGEGHYKTETDYQLSENAFSDKTLDSAGSTYEILFGGSKSICKIIMDRDVDPDDSDTTGPKLYRLKAKRTDNKYEYLFASISNAVTFAQNERLNDDFAGKPVKIEMLQDYLIPSADRVQLSPIRNYEFCTAKDGIKFEGGNDQNRATISRDPGNPNSFVSATKNSDSAGTFNKIIVDGLNFDGRNLAGSGDGGAFNTKNWVVDLKNAEFINFVADNGGAVFIEFGEYKNDTTTYSFDSCNFKDSYMGVENVVFKDCKSISGTSRQGGGAIWTNARKLTITGKSKNEKCRFENCTAVDQGGAIFHRIDAFYNSGNYTFPADDDGKEMYDMTEGYGGTITKVEYCEFVGCQAKAAGGMESDSSIVKVKDCTFTDCRATARNGGGFNVFSNNKADSTNLSMVWVVGSAFTNCHADSISFNTNSGGGLRSAAKRTYVKNTSFSNVSSLHGGAVSMSNTNGDVGVVQGCIIDDAKASMVGGGIYCMAQRMTVDDYKVDGGENKHTQISNCSAEISGGGIYHDSYTVSNNLETIRGTSIINNCIISASSAGKKGGGIYLRTANAELTGATIQNNTAALSGGGICVPEEVSFERTGNTFQKPASSTIKLDDCIVTGNVSGEKGGGVYTDSHIELSDECIIMGNRLTHSTKDNAAGVWITDRKNLILSGSNSDPQAAVNKARIIDNYASNGTASNLRLPERSETDRNNSISVIVKCKNVTGEIRVVNARSQGTTFGTSTIDAPIGFADLWHVFTADDNSLYGILSRAEEPETARTIIWAGEAVCKITDENDNMLYFDSAHTNPAIFDVLDGGSDGSRVSAFSLLRRDGDLTLYTDDGKPASDSGYRVKLLVEEYTPKSMINASANGRSVTLTTASGSDGDGFPYRGTSANRATIFRGSIGNNPLIKVSGNLTLNNIILDGRKDTEGMVDTNTRLLYLTDNSDSKVTLGVNARLINSKVSGDSGDGGAVYVNTGSFVIAGGVIQNCEADHDGGAVYMSGDKGTLTLSSGSITNCRAANNGGAVCVNRGTFVMKDGSIERCGFKAGEIITRNGGAVYVAAGQSMEMTGGTISGNKAKEHGGGITTGGLIFTAKNDEKTKLSFAGNVRVTDNNVNEVPCNVELVDDRNNLIHANGLRSKARIGIYVSGEEDENDSKYDEELFSKHGDINKPFARFHTKADEKYLYCFVNDRNGLKGGIKPADQGDGQTERETVYWVKIYSLKVEMNILSDNPDDQKDKFHYTIKLYTKNEDEDYQYTDNDIDTSINGRFGTEEDGITFKNGVAEFDLPRQNTENFREADSLPKGLVYIVEEVPPENKGNYYTISPGKVQQGMIGENDYPGNPSRYSSTVTFNNIHAICKITDQSVGLLYYRTGNKYIPAVFSELNTAFAQINSDNLFYKGENGQNQRYNTNDCNVEMLVEEYNIPQTAVLGGPQLTVEHKVTLTTADPKATDKYPYTGGNTTAVIKRSSDPEFKTSILSVTNRGNLTLDKIELDGNGTNITAEANGGLVYITGTGDLTITTKAKLSNSVISESYNGAGVFVGQNATLRLKGTPDFGGQGVYTSSDAPAGKTAGDIKGESGNFKIMDMISGSKNGGKTYPESEEENKYLVRQDIYIANTSNVVPASVVIEQKLTGGDSDKGSIWVWAAGDNHGKTLKPFATIAEEVKNDPGNLEVFRNAKPDKQTDNETDDFLYGSPDGDTPAATGEDAGKTFVYWSGITGNRKVILRKVNSAYTPVSGETFTIYKGSSTTAYKPKDAGNALTGLSSGTSGCFWIGTLPYGWYIIEEKGKNEGDSSKFFYMVVAASGTYGTLYTDGGVEKDKINGYGADRSAAEEAAKAKYDAVKTTSSPTS